MTTELLIGLLVFVGIALIVFLKFRKKASTSISLEVEGTSTQPETKVVAEAPAPKKRPSFSRAIESWRRLFEAKSKDRSQWEEALITSDMGPKLARTLIDGLEKSADEPLVFFKSELRQMISPAESQSEPWNEHKPWICFIAGVNGVGKTTTIVKLANHFKKLGKRVAVVGADTFRKAAIEQLQRGAERVGAEFFSIQGSSEAVEGADPSAVIFDGLSKFKDADIVLVDTSGRLHHKKNLMEELKKMKRVAQKVLPDAPHDVWLVIDATLGQNAVSQGRAFHETLQLTGLVLTKLDGLSRGGTVFQLFQELKVPIRFLGYGEAPEDLETFKSDVFVEELFDLRGANP